MRKLSLTLAAATAGLIFAAPAAAQYYPQPNYGYAQPGYGQPAYGYAQPGYGYAQPAYGYGSRAPWLYDFRNQQYASMMQQRVRAIRNDIQRMGAQRILDYREVRKLDRQAQRLEHKVWHFSRNGVSSGEARSIDQQVHRLEERVMRAAYDWNRRPGVRRYNAYDYNRYYGYYGDRSLRDRDRDGRIDRYEDDRGTRHDH